MQKYLIEQVLHKYCTQSHQGLFLLSMPTGFGKTYSVLDFIYKNYRDFANQGRKIFFVTNLKKNLPLQDLEERFKKEGCQEDFAKHVLLIDSNSDSVIENLLLIGNEIPERYTQ
ncbi:MAG: DEAD/DEAH box helicase family protein, partial [Pseudanabaena sp. ELA645]